MQATFPRTEIESLEILDKKSAVHGLSMKETTSARVGEDEN
jgi:hypothetical protein